MAKRPEKRAKKRPEKRGKSQKRSSSSGSAVDVLEGRNPVLECLARKRRRVMGIWVDERSKPNSKLERLFALARAASVPVHPVSREVLDRRSVTGVHNGVIAEVTPHPRLTTASLLDRIDDQGETPFLID